MSPMHILRSLLCIFLLAATSAGNAQTALQKIFENLQKVDNLPQGLRSDRSAVFLKVNQIYSRDSVDWYSLASEFHKSLVSLNIDAIAYYRWRDLNAGKDATESYLQTIADRGANQVIILEVEQGAYTVWIISTDLENPGLFSENSTAWYIAGSSMENLISNLELNIRRGDLEVGNFLISESPEIFVDTQIFRKNRFEQFQPDLKLDKLAAPLFVSHGPENIESSMDLELQQIMQRLYPFNYELVGTNMTEDLMQKAGFHYVLRYLHAEESTLETLLDYENIARNAPEFQYKFYIKHLISGDVYLGDSWDGRPSWQEALNTHLDNMRRSLKVEQ